MSDAAPRGPTLRPMTVADLVDEIFRLYRANAKLFFGVAAVIWLPSSVAYLAMQLLFFRNDLLSVGAQELTPQQIGDTLAGALGVVLVATVVGIIALPILFGALTAAVSARYTGRPLTIDGAVRRAMACYWRLVSSYTLLILSLIGAALGAILLAVIAASAIGGTAGFLVALLGVVGAIVLFVWLGATWAFVGQVIVVEDAGVVGSFGRSRALVSGSRWRVIGINLLLALIESVLFTVPSAFVNVLTNPLPDPAGTAVGSLITAFAQIAYFPVQLGTLTLLYYDLRVRKEGLDLALAAEQLAPA